MVNYIIFSVKVNRTKVMLGVSLFDYFYIVSYIEKNNTNNRKLKIRRKNENLGRLICVSAGAENRHFGEVWRGIGGCRALSITFPDVALR